MMGAEMMNVLMMVTWYTPKGSDKLEAGVFHYEQSMALKKYCNVAIWAPFDQDVEGILEKGEEWDLLTYRSHFTPGRLLKNRNHMFKIFKSIAEDFKPDILHAHCAAGAGHYAVWLGKKFGIPVVVTEHSPVELSGVGKLGMSHFFGKYAYAGSQANICVSRDSRDKLSAIYPKYKFDVIYNGIILPDYEEKEKQFYKEGYLNIVIVAVLYDLEIKGMKYLLEAIRILKAKGEKVVLHHIGGGEYLEHFKKLSNELNIEDVCIFHGKCRRKELYEIVNEMDFFVSASLVECSGVSVQEAMLLGKPVLGTNSGGVDSLVPKEAGIIVEKANAQALAEGIQQMRSALDRYDTGWIKKYAYDSFEIDNISKRYMDLYKGLANDSL